MLSRSYLLIFYIENHENKKSPPVKQSGKHFYKFLDTLNYDLLYFLLSDLNKTPKPIESEDMREQIERGLLHSMQTHEKILISY